MYNKCILKQRKSEKFKAFRVKAGRVAIRLLVNKTSKVTCEIIYSFTNPWSTKETMPSTKKFTNEISFYIFTNLKTKLEVDICYLSKFTHIFS